MNIREMKDFDHTGSRPEKIQILRSVNNCYANNSLECYESGSVETISYSFVNPPIYSLIAVTTFIAIVFGILFKDMLEYQVATWQYHRKTQVKIEYQRPSLILTYLGLCGSILVFLSACLSVFGFSWTIATVIAGLMVVFLGGLIWWQMGIQLDLLVQGGSAALDLDFDPTIPEVSDPGNPTNE